MCWTAQGKRSAIEPPLSLVEHGPGMLLECMVDSCPLTLEGSAIGSWKGNWGLSLLYKARLSWCERRVEVAYVLSEHLGNDNCREEEGVMIVLASRGAICWVLFAGHISCVEMDVLRFSEGVDVLENGLVSASALPPTLNDSSVVSEDFDVSAFGSGRG